jgi:pyruvate/2-oxoglutarate dehydrogenase complex dihydrolipoamide acyltransferase (E2) component
MAFGKRNDGVRLKKLPGFRKMFPYLMRTRTESLVYFSKRLAVAPTMSWLDRTNARRDKKLSFFYVVLAAGVRTLALRPEVNRFVAGRRIYQRRTIDLSFIVKRELTEEASEITLKLSFDPRSTIDEVAQRVRDAIGSARESATSWDEKLTNLITSMPRPLTRLAVAAVQFLDYHGWLPASFIRDDSLHTSAFLANLGSIGLDAAFHHLYEWGNASVFVVVGRLKKEPAVNERVELEVADVVDMNFTGDERITDGVYFSRTMDLFLDLIKNPERLETPPADLPDPFALA